VTYSTLVSCKAVSDQSVGKELPAVALESFECLPGRRGTVGAIFELDNLSHGLIVCILVI
jgi:hypothetical protein